MSNTTIDLGAWLGEAWELYKKNFALLFVTMLVASLLTLLTCGVLAGPMWAGMTLILLRLLRNETPQPQIGDLFKGFDFFLQSLLLALVIGVAYVVVSWVPFIGAVASFLIAPLVVFSMSLVVDRKIEFWPAIQTSFEKAKDEYVSLLVLTLLASLISAAGALLCGIGVIFTMPFSPIVAVVAYRHMFDEAPAEPVPVIEAEIIDPPPQA